MDTIGLFVMERIESVIFDWGGVLIDDRQDYVHGAKQAGLNAILFKGIGQVKSELTELGVK